MPRILSVFGLGYVGSVTAACLAHKGNRVIGVDVNPAKVETLQAGRSPVLEKGIDEIVAESSRAGRLHATTSVADAVAASDASFICVGTPNLRNGEHDLRQIERVILEIGTAMRGKDGFHTVVLRSTVMPGTTESVVIPKLEEASGKLVGKDFGVCYNPEFLREGSAVSDFLEPTITVLGAATSDHLRGIREIYAWVPGKVFETSLSTAETVKSMIESIMTSNHDHIERAVEEVLRTGKKKIGVLGLSFKTGTDDLRGSPLVMVIKRLLGEGCQVRIWDRDVALGRLVGSNRQFIEEVIPHIGTLLTPELADVLRDAEVVVIGTRAIDKETLRSHLQPEQHVVDLVNIEKARRVDGHAAYEGICW